MVPISVKGILRGVRGILFLKNPRGELELPGGGPMKAKTSKGRCVAKLWRSVG